jgi:hypothetical protein
MRKCREGGADELGIKAASFAAFCCQLYALVLPCELIHKSLCASRMSCLRKAEDEPSAR